jgi:adenylosuccinate lyase
MKPDEKMTDLIFSMFFEIKSLKDRQEIKMESIKAISPLDGRYSGLTQELKDIFSEYGLIKNRVKVETQWLKFLVRELKIAEISEAELSKADAIIHDFNASAANEVKDIEKITNHDVKAVEYYIKQRLTAMELASIKEWVHFACTSDDINNTSYALMLKEGRDLISGLLEQLLQKLEALAREHKAVAMMSRTHGQPATPTTVGKEFVNFAWRVRTELETIRQCPIQAKMNGATGNFNAHLAAFPAIDWIAASEHFISEYLAVEPILYTTQINPCNYIAGLLHAMIRAASIVIDLDRDMWGYISFGYFKQKLKEGEVGSSTMPHKVNPIDFENGEGNMGIAISMMEHLAVKLLNSRFQRDLTDSTVLRSLGSLFGYFMIGIKNTLKGLNKVDLNRDVIEKDLQNNLELLAEPVQTVMRVYGEENPYEQLKALTRGRKITPEALRAFVDGLENVPADAKDKLRAMTPATYTGLAEKLVDRYFAS